MKFLIVLLVFVSVASAMDVDDDTLMAYLRKLGNGTSSRVIVDYYDSYRFEDHRETNGTHFLLAVRDNKGHKECHVIEIDDNMEEIMNTIIKYNKTDADMLFRDIYNYIRDVPESEMPINDTDFLTRYQDKFAAHECDHHKIFFLPYTPSFTVEDLYHGESYGNGTDYSGDDDDDDDYDGDDDDDDDDDMDGDDDDDDDDDDMDGDDDDDDDDDDMDGYDDDDDDDDMDDMIGR